jgi:peptidoglycan/xylan/chitin deacetylase (PgdA/CDA1 family)
MYPHPPSYANGERVSEVGLVLVYHGVFRDVPAELGGAVHNVTPWNLGRQLDWLNSHCKIVPLDAMFDGSSPRGKVAITFDDGYKSVFTEAAPLLFRRGIPFTVFINGGVLEKGTFWRDKIRWLINSQRVESFLSFRAQLWPGEPEISAVNFYRGSKTPEVNSRILDGQIDDYVDAQGLGAEVKKLSRFIAGEADLINHPLITYGNHTLNHYVLSSLPVVEQAAEIAGNDDVLQHLGVPRSAIFAIPFGDARDTPRGLATYLRSQSFNGMLFSRNRFNVGDQLLFACERFMPSDGWTDFHRNMLRIHWKCRCSPTAG